jgi:hypothetical protein
VRPGPTLPLATWIHFSLSGRANVFTSQRHLFSLSLGRPLLFIPTCIFAQPLTPLS